MAEIVIKDLRQRHIEDFLKERREIQAGLSGLTPASFGDALVGFAAALKKAVIEKEEYNVTLAQFVTGLISLDERRTEISQVEMNCVNVQAAIRCEWFDDLAEDAVGDLEAWRVTELSNEITALINDALTVPKN